MLTNLIQTLLDDDHGISTEAYDALLSYLSESEVGYVNALAKRISDVAEAIDGRWFIPEGSDLRPTDFSRMGVK